VYGYKSISNPIYMITKYMKIKNKKINMSTKTHIIKSHNIGNHIKIKGITSTLFSNNQTKPNPY
jgi:hypothetical protein